MLSDGYTKNFETLIQAVQNQDACLLEARRKADGQTVALLCAVNPEEGPERERLFIPLAVMVEGNPYEMFDPPDPKGGFHDRNCADRDCCFCPDQDRCVSK